MKMFVVEYQEDGWSATERWVDAPSWPEVESALRALDRFRLPFVWLYSEDRAHAGNIPDFEVIGGDGAYALCGLEGGAKRRYLNRDGGEEQIPVWTSDQGIDMEAKYVCGDIETVLRAARFFHDYGRLDPTLEWVPA